MSEITFEYDGRTYRTESLPTWVGRIIILRDTLETVIAQVDLERMPPAPGNIVLKEDQGLTAADQKNSEIDEMIAVLARALNAVVAVPVEK